MSTRPLIRFVRLAALAASLPLTFAVAPLVLAAVVLLASGVPALRATRVPPGSVPPWFPSSATWCASATI